MVVRRVEDFDGCVASVRGADGVRGYLRVRIVHWKDANVPPGVDMDLVLKTHMGWQFSDRADPDPSDAVDELNSGSIQWYGQELAVQHWLDHADADSIVAEHFAPE